jgi:hypothetical protein
MAHAKNNVGLIEVSSSWFAIKILLHVQPIRKNYKCIVIHYTI